MDRSPRSPAMATKMMKATARVKTDTRPIALWASTRSAKAGMNRRETRRFFTRLRQQYRSQGTIITAENSGRSPRGSQSVKT